MPDLATAITRDPSGYVAYHAPRYRRLLALSVQHAGSAARVLDIGVSPFTPILAHTLGTPVDSLGFGPDGAIAHGRHFEFDLNDSNDPSRWRTDLPTYDLIVFAEVLEHLYTAPRPVLAFLRTLLTPGGILLLQTPNAVVAHKRVQMLLGRNPFHRISEDRTNPAHYREYTRAELIAESSESGLEIASVEAGAYFDYRHAAHAVGDARPRRILGCVNLFYTLAPGSFRPGLTLVLRHPG